MNTLHAGGLVLEPLAQHHAAPMFEVLGDPAIYEFENAPPPSLDGLRERYRRLESRRSPDGGEQWLNWVLRLPSGTLAGYVQATVRADGTALVAYELAGRHWRQGLGSSAMRAMLDELASSYAVHTAVAVFKAANFRSEALLRSLGFVEPRRGTAPHIGCEPDERVMSKALAGAHG